ncbi:glycosyltransferase family 39 protein [Rufibacter sp. XAAS-G3-1]|uniref:glycosyltransferase family 39 protein n=1 Tax=Rufibacter sp. XAAS-G3-1 TaxID=2729134 RepID=UPI0015E7A263|nr:glycosyltransferase family 39 protein [Rufibacter sp. XAAS-G3-1]
MGIFFRLFHYFDNRSLWLDEIYLAASLVKMDLQQLTFSDLEYEQKAPIGFLWMCKLAVLLFGTSEMSLRLFPLLCGILSLFMFLPVVRYFLKPLGVAVAIGILALAPPLIYHGVEIKQYSTELLASILCLYLYTRYHKKRDIASLVMWGVWGSVIIWFSYTSIFILAGMAMGITIYHLLRKEWVTVFLLVIPFGLWLVSFAVNYFGFTARLAEAEWLLHYFRVRGAFMPVPPTSLGDLAWPIKNLGTRLLHYPLGLLWDVSEIENGVLRYLLRRPIFAVACTLMGLLLFLKRDKKFLLVLVLPFLLLMVASALELYPIWERLTVFLAPLLILIVALGCERLAAYSQWINRRVAFFLAMLVLAAPFWASASQVMEPRSFGDYKKSFYREALLGINKHFRKDDQVYVYWNMLTPYRFYSDIHAFNYKAIEGSDFRKASISASDYLNKLTTELNSLKKTKRVWVFYSKRLSMNIGDFEMHPSWYVKEVLGKQRLQKKFSEIGKEIYSFETYELKASLFEVKAQ